MAADASDVLHDIGRSGTCREGSIIGPRYRRWTHVRNSTCSSGWVAEQQTCIDKQTPAKT
jgi:hypothetical protein